MFLEVFFEMHCLSLTFAKQNAKTDLTLVEKTGWSKKRMRAQIKKDRDPPSAHTCRAEGPRTSGSGHFPQQEGLGQGLGFTENIDSFSNLFVVL